MPAKDDAAAARTSGADALSLADAVRRLSEGFQQVVLRRLMREGQGAQDPSEDPPPEKVNGAAPPESAAPASSSNSTITAGDQTDRKASRYV
jgi:hypothetical protein